MIATMIRDWPMATRVAAGLLGAIVLVDLGVATHSPGITTTDAARAMVVDAPAGIPINAPNDVTGFYQALRRSPFDLPGGSTTPEPALALNAPAAPVAPVAAAPAEPRLIGTVTQGASGGFVMLELADKRIQLVHVGELAGDLKLRTVSLGEATFDGPAGKRVTIRTARPSADTAP